MWWWWWVGIVVVVVVVVVVIAVVLVVVVMKRVACVQGACETVLERTPHGRNGSFRMYRSSEWLITLSCQMISKLHRVSRQLARALLVARGERGGGKVLFTYFCFIFFSFSSLYPDFVLQEFCSVRIIIEECVMN